MELKFDITGMTCAACSARVEKVTNAVAGVKRAEVNLLAGTMQVQMENEDCVSQIISAVHNAGYGASVCGLKSKKKVDQAPEEHVLKKMKVRIIGSAAF